LDVEGRFVFANDRAVAVLGLEQSAVTDRRYNDPEWRIRDLDGDPIPDEELPFRQVCDTGEPLYGFRHAIRWPDGTEKELLINGAPLFDDEGAVDGVVFSLVDVTDQREQEQRLREAEHRLELAMEATETGVWEWEPATGTVVWDETLERVVGLEPGSFEGTYEAVAERIHPDDLSVVEREVNEALETDGEYHAEFRMRRPDGELLWVEGRAKVVDDGNGRRLIGIHHDITERKRRERELERTKRRLDSILENTTMPMFLKDADGEYLLVNRGYRELFGLEEANVIGHTDEEIHPAPMTAEVRANDQWVVERGEPLTVEERIVVDGEERIFLVSKAPVHDGGEDGEPTAVFGVAKDITEREAYRTKLEEQNELLEEFAAVVSHDLRSPLTVAQGRVELAAEDRDDPHLDAAANALDRSQQLIDDLLALAREGAGAIDAEPTSLADAIQRCWRTVETGNATLTVETTRTIKADRGRLQQLLQNLVRNAVEHGSTNSRPEADDAVEHGGSDIAVTVGDLPDGFYVADDGPGIPEAERERAFDIGHSTEDGNTGFGLAIAARGHAITTRRVVISAPWQIVIFSVGMYLVVYGLRNQGLTGEIAGTLDWLAGQGMTVAAVGTGFIVAFFSSIMNNMPAVMVVALSIDESGASGLVKEAMIYANIIGSDLGPKITPIGSLATLLWLHVLARKGMLITWGQYFRIGILITPPVLLITLLALAGWLSLIR
jgi:PAS domain S-box-containing protein